MNETTIRNNRAGFGYSDTLLSRLSFSGIIRVWEKNKFTKSTPEGEIEYWSIRDEYGARMMSFSEDLYNKLVVGERYEVFGEIKIGKGSIYLSLKRAKPMQGGEFCEQ